MKLHHSSDVGANPSKFKHILVVANPVTRRYAPSVLDLLRNVAPAGVDFDIRLTTSEGMTTTLTRAGLSGADAVVAIGGDGTVADVATALHGSGLSLGIIPTGSTNIVAQELRIPRNPLAACNLIFGSNRHTAVDVGRWGDRSFLHMAGAGIDSYIFEGTDPALKRRIGWLAYLSPATRSLLRPPIHFRIVADDSPIEVQSPLVLIANGRSVISRHLWLHPDIKRDDGLLDVLVFTPRGPLPIARTLSRLVTRGLDHSPYVTHLTARKVELFSDTPVPVEIDGDVVAMTPVTFLIAPAALGIMVPVV